MLDERRSIHHNRSKQFGLVTWLCCKALQLGALNPRICAQGLRGCRTSSTRRFALEKYQALEVALKPADHIKIRQSLQKCVVL